MSKKEQKERYLEPLRNGDHREAFRRVLTKNVLEGLQKAYRKDFPRELTDYLKLTYGEEPFPYEYSEQDLYTQVQRDIDYYYAGKLVITVGKQ